MPKTVAINYPDRTSLLVARAISFFVAIFGPILIAVEVLRARFVETCRRRYEPPAFDFVGHEELKSAVDLLHREGGVARSDRDMFGGLLDLRDLEVSDVMVHRTKMLALNADLPPQELIREVVAAPYSRLPLWRGEPENIVGVLHARDLLRALDSGRRRSPAISRSRASRSNPGSCRIRLRCRISSRPS